MTKIWNPDGIWQGETVAILGAGPDMTAELAATAKGYKTIAVNRAVKFAPWADMFVALDPHHPFWEEADRLGFTGLRVCGVECDYDALYAGMFYETVQMGEGHTLQIRNNALAALRIAARAGAKKIILLGFDPVRYEEVHAHTGFSGLVQGLAQITAELRANGIEVEQIDSKEQKPGTRAPRRGESVDAETFPKRKK
ncbi:hypothetical protein [Propionivibrio sp.]|uniref:hypothetical protein n=1 Tax=Propionivibrio sp. TaxID=2212460 RepID=UPI003BF2C6B2